MYCTYQYRYLLNPHLILFQAHADSYGVQNIPNIASTWILGQWLEQHPLPFPTPGTGLSTDC